MDEMMMVGKAVHVQVLERGLAALAARPPMMRLTLGSRTVASPGPLAMLVAEDHGTPEMVGDVVGGADVQHETGAAERPAQHAGTEESGQATGA